MQEGGGEAWGRTTGAKALFCLTAETIGREKEGRKGKRGRGGEGRRERERAVSSARAGEGS